MIKKPLDPFGTAVSCLDIKQISPSTFTELARLIAESRVVVFRSQTLEDADFVRF